MHILYFTSSLSFGGAEKIMVGLAEQAVQHSHEASILTVCPGNDFSDRLHRAGISFKSLGYTGRFTPRNLASIIRLRQALKTEIRQIDPDLIHVQLFIPKILTFGMSSGIEGYPVVHTQQDTSPWWQQHTVYARMQTFVERMFSRRTVVQDVAISEAVREKMVAHGFSNGRPPTVIHNFTELTRSKNIELEREKEEGKLFMISRLVWDKKGLDTAIHVLKQLRAQKCAVRLVVVGDGDDRGRMEAYAEKEGVKPFVEFRGYQDNVLSQYEEADLILMPSRWEGLSVTGIEALKMGVPIVGSRIGGIKELVEHGETGYTCPPEDVSCFVRHIKRLLDDHSLRKQFAENSIERAQQFTPERAFEAYEEVYRSALKSER